jgi:PASTA domain
VSEPTPSERVFAYRFGLAPETLASARDVLNAIARLPWPEPERVSLLARLARAAHADVGEVFGGRALRAAPLSAFDALMPISGLAEKRISGLARALATVDMTQISQPVPPDVAARITALQAENAVLRTELDKWRAAAEPQARPASMRLGDVVSSIASQTAEVVETLHTRSRALRLIGMELHLAGAAAAVENDLALDFDAAQAGSAFDLSFATGGNTTARSTVAVPNVVGYTPALARRKLAGLGFQARLSTFASAAGVVAEQSPSAGSSAAYGSLVQLLIR